MAATEIIQVPGVEGVIPLSARLIHVNGKYDEIGVTNKLRTPVIINEVFYISKDVGSRVEGVKEKLGIVKSDEEIRFTVSVPSTLDLDSFSIRLTFYAETHGVNFTTKITVDAGLKTLSARIIQVTGEDAEISVTNNRGILVTIPNVFYVCTAGG